MDRKKIADRTLGVHVIGLLTLMLTFSVAAPVAHSQETPALETQREPHDLPEAPRPKKIMIITNAAMCGSSFVLAHSANYGTIACKHEVASAGTPYALYTSAVGGARHPYKKTFAVALPLDAGVSMVSIFLHRKHHSALSVWLPGVSMGVQFGAAALQYGGGCT